MPFLRAVRLARPITNSVELHFLLTAIHVVVIGQPYEEAGEPDIDRYERLGNAFIDLFVQAREHEIRRCMARVAAYIDEPLEVERDQDVYRFVSFLFQWPEAHRGRLAGLVTKALRWHGRLVGPNDVVRLLGLSLQQRTVPPPVAPPGGKGIRFLATVADIAAEGREMRHCAYSALRSLFGRLGSRRDGLHSSRRAHARACNDRR